MLDMLCLRISLFVAPQDTYLLGLQSIEKKRRMRGYQQLRALAGRAAFFGQFPKQPGMEKIFRLLNTDKGRRILIMKQDQIGQHFERPVGSEPSQHRVTERSILDLQ